MRTFTRIIGLTATWCVCACSETASTGDGGSVMKKAEFSTGTGVATLSWAPPRRNMDGTALNDLAGYYIYYGKNPDDLNGVIEIFDPYATTHTVDHLDPGTYYFKIVPFTAKGVKGSASPLVSKTIR
jgi:hypothetical protein